MGLVASANLSARLKYCTPHLQQEVETVLKASGLPVRIPDTVMTKDIITAMHKDKKRKGEQLYFILMRDIGDVFIKEGVPQSRVVETIEALIAAD